MKYAKIILRSFDDKSTITKRLNGVDNLKHANECAQILAVKASAINKEAFYVSMVTLYESTEQEFGGTVSAHPHPDITMDRVKEF
jgi:hypothetical protein